MTAAGRGKKALPDRRLDEPAPVAGLPVAPNPPEAIARLCPACGLCCNGVLFTDVKLEPGDDPVRLGQLGFKFRKRGRTCSFGQPCAAHEQSRCRIYAERPAYCRDFECRLLQKVQAGKMTAAKALTAIGQALQRVAEVEDLLSQLGRNRPDQPLSRRYRNLMSEPWDFGADRQLIQVRGKILKAIFRLARCLERDFLA